MAGLADLSNDVASLVDRCGASVVSIDARRGRSATGIVWADNLVVTADHVLEHEDEINVTSAAGTVSASITGRDSGTDLALLKTNGLNAPAAHRAQLAGVRQGQIVLAMGRPGELQLTLGIVSGISAAYRSWRGAQVERLIETTADLLPGFSGGPLLDAEGRVIGVNSWNFGRGISRALPTDTVEKVIESLQSHGRIRRAYLGVGSQPVRLSERLERQLGQPTGLLVVTVEAGGPAAQAGILQGDTIAAVDGEAIRGLDDLFNAVRRLEVGSAHTVRLIRAGELKEVKLTAGERAS
jgi:S1-C subfamily serine protease